MLYSRACINPQYFVICSHTLLTSYVLVCMQAVSCLAFSDSGGLLVSGGEDTLVAAWLLGEVLDEQRDGPAAAAAAVGGMARVEPLHTW
jgi:hypothetical protein